MISHLPLPRYIALCGFPGSGKSEAQSILQDHHGVMSVDDGMPMREFAVSNLGCTWDQVRTQGGKKEFVTINGRDFQVRDILGQLGNKFEELFGGDIMCEMALNRIALEERSANRTRQLCNQRPFVRNQSYCFGSVRRDQGFFYQRAGGIVLEIRNPLAKLSPFAFDRFNPDAIDMAIDNDGLARGLEPAAARIDLKLKLEIALLAFHNMRQERLTA